MITRWDKHSGVTIETKAGYIHRRTDITDPLDLIPVRHRAGAEQNIHMLGMFEKLEIVDNSHAKLFYPLFIVHLLGRPIYGTADSSNLRPTPLRTAARLVREPAEEARAGKPE